MSLPSLEAEIRDFIVATFLYGEDDGLDVDDSLLGRGVIDSTGVLELVAFLEGRYATKIQDREIVPDHFDSVRRLAAFVARKLSVEQAA